MQQYYNKSAQFEALKQMNQDLQREDSFLALTNKHIDANAERMREELDPENQTALNTVIGDIHELCGEYVKLKNPEVISRTIRTTVNDQEWNLIQNSGGFVETKPLVPRHIQEYEKQKEAGLIQEITLIGKPHQSPQGSSNKSPKKSPKKTVKISKKKNKSSPSTKNNTSPKVC
jgi:hypothetical protein